MAASQPARGSRRRLPRPTAPEASRGPRASSTRSPRFASPGAAATLPCESGRARPATHDRAEWHHAQPSDGARCPSPRRRHGGGPGRCGQCLQLVGLYRRGRARTIRGRDRHQGRLRRLRQQRGAGDQAARRGHRIRRGRADGQLPAAPDPGRRVHGARHVEAAQSGAYVGSDHGPASPSTIPATSTPSITCGEPPGIGYNVDAAKARLGTRADRQLVGAAGAGKSRQVRGLRGAFPRRADRVVPRHAPTTWARIPTARIRRRCAPRRSG